MSASPLLPSTRHRTDIQALRAVAVLLVVLNHVGVGFLKGGYIGVDVFFVISGYLITGLLLSGAIRDRRVSITDFYVRRAKRILPAATLTLVATAVASYTILNVVRAKQAITDTIWSSLFAANIRFTRVGTDYFAQGQPPSPLRHFWSLAVEEQFYLVWPAVFGVTLFGAAGLRRWYRHRRHRAPGHTSSVTARGLSRPLAIALVIGAASLAWSLHQTHTAPTTAYFSTLTRAWELALGAVLAMSAHRLTSLSAPARTIMSWAGLVAILAAAVLYTDATPFPGAAALLPTVGTALLLAAGIATRPPRLAAGSVLAIPPMRFIGDISYTLYLWHWPILVLAAAQHGGDGQIASLSPLTRLLLMVGALALSAFTYTCFEDPLRRTERWSEPGPVLLAWVISPLIVVLVAIHFQSKFDAQALAEANSQSQASVERAAEKELLGATETPAQRKQRLAQQAKAAERQAAQQRLEIAGGTLAVVTQAVAAVGKSAPIPTGLTPDPPSLGENDIYKLPPGCEAQPGASETSSPICRLGVKNSKKTMVVLGDSHGQMWMGNFIAAGTHDGMAVIPLIKASCTITMWGGYKPKPGCVDWYKWASSKARALKADTVVISGHYLTGVPVEQASQTLQPLIRALKKTAKHVVVMGDVYGVAQQPVDCLLRKGATMSDCSTSLSAANANDQRTISGVATSSGAGFVDPTGWFCANQTCPTVIGHQVAYFDEDHVTSVYAERLKLPFISALGRAAKTS